VDPIAGLDDVERKKFLTIPGLELRPVGRPARFFFIVILFVRLLALRSLLTYCASLR
jgi:hypothetical protein